MKRLAPNHWVTFDGTHVWKDDNIEWPPIDCNTKTRIVQYEGAYELPEDRKRRAPKLTRPNPRPR